MNSQNDGDNRRVPAKKHFVKPLLLAQDSIHVPSHVLLPRGSLFAHPYPESVYPFETHEQLSLSELREQTTAERNHFKFDTNSFQWTGEYGKQGAINSRGPREEKNTAGDVVKSIPVLPFKAAVVCLILNIIIPGGGKWIISFSMAMMSFCPHTYSYDSLNYLAFGIVRPRKPISLGERIQNERLVDVIVC